MPRIASHTSAHMTSQLVASEDLNVAADIAFSRICAVHTWPVWLSFVRRAELDDASGILTHASDIVLASDLADGKDEVFEVEELIAPYLLTLVGAFSCRRRMQFRVEQHEAQSRIVVKVAYPTHGGIVQRYTDRLLLRRKLHAALAQSVQTFKGLVEHDASERDERASALLLR